MEIFPPQAIAGWEQEQTTLDEISDRVRFYEGVFPPVAAKLAAKQLSAAYWAVRKAGITEGPIYLDDDDRLMFIPWDCSTPMEDDAAIVAEVKAITGVDIEAGMNAARVLAYTADYRWSDELTVFNTGEGSTGLHRDGEQEAFRDGREWQPDSTFVRDILHLRGQRTLHFCEYKDDIPLSVSLAAGDGYQLHPKAVFHEAEYSRRSLAIYIQGYTS